MSTSSKFDRVAFEYTPNPSRVKQKCPPGMVWDQSSKSCIPEDLPKSRKGEPARIGPLPKAAQKLWVQTYDRALKRFKQKGPAAAVAWARIKKECYKDYDGIWQCPELVKRADIEKRAKKLRREAKKAKKEEGESTAEAKDLHKKMRMPPKKKRPT